MWLGEGGGCLRMEDEVEGRVGVDFREGAFEEELTMSGVSLEEEEEGDND